MTDKPNRWAWMTPTPPAAEEPTQPRVGPSRIFDLYKHILAEPIPAATGIVDRIIDAQTALDDTLESAARDRGLYIERLLGFRPSPSPYGPGYAAPTPESAQARQDIADAWDVDRGCVIVAFDVVNQSWVACLSLDDYPRSPEDGDVVVSSDSLAGVHRTMLNAARTARRLDEEGTVQLVSMDYDPPPDDEPGVNLQQFIEQDDDND